MYDADAVCANQSLSSIDTSSVTCVNALLMCAYMIPRERRFSAGTLPHMDRSVMNLARQISLSSLCMRLPSSSSPHSIKPNESVRVQRIQFSSHRSSDDNSDKRILFCTWPPQTSRRRRRASLPPTTTSIIFPIEFHVYRSTCLYSSQCMRVISSVSFSRLQSSS